MIILFSYKRGEGYEVMFDLTGQRAIVTGAAQGLGYGMVKGLLTAGAEVVIFDYSENLEQATQTLREFSNNVHAIQVDLSQPAAIEEAFSQAIQLLGGKVDILINNAAINQTELALDLTIQTWQKVLNVNVIAAFQLSQLAGDIMIKQGHGKIINVGSIRSFVGSLQGTAYSASKGAIAQLTKSLSNEWAKFGIQVNAIAPGFMQTPASDKAGIFENKPLLEEINRRIPAGRWGTPEDLEGLVVFLSSAASNYITGAIIPCDGGFLAR